MSEQRRFEEPVFEYSDAKTKAFFEAEIAHTVSWYRRARTRGVVFKVPTLLGKPLCQEI